LVGVAGTLDAHLIIGHDALVRARKAAVTESAIAFIPGFASAEERPKCVVAPSIEGARVDCLALIDILAFHATALETQVAGADEGARGIDDVIVTRSLGMAIV
jgi:hypothetical protein